MNVTPEQFEEIVRQVLVKVGTQTSGRGAAPAAPPAPLTGTTDGVKIAGQVITQALLAETPRDGGTVRIGTKAILTPSARDFVSQHGIKIVRESAGSASQSAAHWQAIVTRSSPHIAEAVASLKSAGIVCALRLLGQPQEAADAAISAVCRGEATQIVIFTDHPELLACLANRNGAIRAAVAGDVTTIERSRHDLTANVLAIDPTNKSVHELKSLLKAFSAR
jgi:hypothetical protein